MVLKADDIVSGPLRLLSSPPSPVAISFGKAHITRYDHLHAVHDSHLFPFAIDLVHYLTRPTDGSEDLLSPVGVHAAVKMSADSSDISQLTEAQQEVLQTYTSVTDQDPIAAIPLLRRSEWNAQIAITRFFEGEPTTDILAEAQAAIPAPTSRQTTNLQYESVLAASRPPPRAPSTDTVQPIDISSSTLPQYQPGILIGLLLTPFRILYRVFSTILSPLSFVIPPFAIRFFANLLTNPRPTRRYLPPAETTSRFIREFNEQYPSTTTLPWSTTGFNLTLDTAKQRQRFLLVVLLSPSHDETDFWVQETLQSSAFSSFLQSHSSDLILWGGSLRDSEAYQLSSNLSCTKFPFAALICQTPTSPSSTSANGGNMTVVSRLTGPMPASEMVAKLGAAMTTHQAALRAARAQQLERDASRSLREEQDSAYERSLAQDRERTRRRREEERARADAEKEALRKVQEAETLKRRREQWRRWRAGTIAPVPDVQDKQAIRLSIRLPDGQRVIRRFDQKETVEGLYAFVECYDILHPSQDEDETESEGQSMSYDRPVGYEHEYGFRLVSPMPRKVYDVGTGGTIAEKIGKGTNLITEMIEDDDDEEDGGEGTI